MISLCINCGRTMVKRRANHIFCTSGCRNKYWVKKHPRVKIDVGRDNN